MGMILCPEYCIVKCTLRLSTLSVFLWTALSTSLSTGKLITVAAAWVRVPKTTSLYMDAIQIT